jgi:redox-sensitive bicupin YhaK (pirin superfamily)
LEAQAEDARHPLHPRRHRPTPAFGSEDVYFVSLADGIDESHLGCAHLDPGATIESAPQTHAAALLVVHGRVTIGTHHPSSRVQVHAGMGCVFAKDERYTMHSESSAIILIVEADKLDAEPRGISTPQRIAGQT